MNALASLAFEALGVTDTDVRLGYKNVTIQMADGSNRAMRLRRLEEPKSSAALFAYAQTGDASALLMPMLGDAGTPEFFASLALGESARLANIAIALQLSPSQMMAALQNQLANLTAADAKQIAAEAVAKVTEEAASHEGGFHG